MLYSKPDQEIILLQETIYMYLMAGWVMLCLFVVLTVLSNTFNPSRIKFQSSALLERLWTVILTWLVLRLGLQVSSGKNFFK